MKHWRHLASMMCGEDRKRYLKERRKIYRMRRNRKKNPIDCCECIMEDTCVKRRKHGLVFGISHMIIRDVDKEVK